jgi:sterol desaturase/sphingolipid hydroxylase (fatty acid hydroxylase superfamily)
MIFLGIAAAGILALLERWWPARREASQWSLNIGVWAWCLALQLLALSLVSGFAVAVGPRLGLPHLMISAWPPVWSAAAYLVAMDLGEYLYHRAQHAIPWLWRMHALHHSDPNMNATTTMRHWWGDAFLKAVTIWPVVAITLHPSASDYLVYALVANYNFFTHANLPVSFGRFSWILNSPAYHRRHHSREPEHFGSNYAALLPIFDVILGSYRRPAAQFPPTGLERAPKGLADTIVWPAQWFAR